MSKENGEPTTSVDRIVMRLLTDEKNELVKIHWVEEDVLWGALRKLARMVRDAKPMVESDAMMVADLSRFAPLPPDAQAKHDRTHFPCERWLEEFVRAIKSA
jgi:hypothetical protein